MIESVDEWVSNEQGGNKLKFHDELTQLGLDRAFPLELQIRRAGRGNDLQVVLVPVEEVVLLEKFLPGSLAKKNAVDNLAPPLKLLCHDHLSRLCDVVSRAHRWVCRCDDRHAMKSVSRVESRIPYANRQGPVLDRLEQHRLGPLPLQQDEKEAAHNRTRHFIWIQLADARDEHGPCNTAEESEHVGINSASTGP